MYDPTKIKKLRASKKKDLRYWQTNLKPLGDIDKDQKLNVVDCFPYDPNRQGIGDVVKKGVQKIKDFKEEHKKQKEEEKKKAETYLYLIVQAQDGKWYNLGAYSVDVIEQLIKKAEKQYKKVLVSEDKKKADKLNRVQMYEKFEGGVEKALTKGVEGVKQLKEEITKLPQREDGIGRMVRDIGRGPSGMPPRSKGWWGSSAYQGTPKISMPQRVETVPVGNGEDLEYQEVDSDYEGQEIVKPQNTYGYSHKSPFYQDKSSFFNYAKGVETCVPYRPVGRYQVFAPYKPVGRKSPFYFGRNDEDEEDTYY